MCAPIKHVTTYLAWLNAIKTIGCSGSVRYGHVTSKTRFADNQGYPRTAALVQPIVWSGSKLPKGPIYLKCLISYQTYTHIMKDTHISDMCVFHNRGLLGVSLMNVNDLDSM